MFITAEDWIDRFKKAGCRIEIDGQSMRPFGPVSAECLAIWDEIRPPVDPDHTRWNAVEAEIRRRIGDVGTTWAIYPNDAHA
jgi:hypothetical protein